MHIQVETDNHIEGRQALQRHVEASLRRALDHLGDKLTRVVAHLSDASAGTRSAGVADYKCLLEAHVTGLKDVAVSHHAPSVHQSIDGAIGRLKHALDAAIDKRDDAQRRAEAPGRAAADAAPDGTDGA